MLLLVAGAGGELACSLGPAASWLPGSSTDTLQAAAAGTTCSTRLDRDPTAQGTCCVRRLPPGASSSPSSGTSAHLLPAPSISANSPLPTAATAPAWVTADMLGRLLLDCSGSRRPPAVTRNPAAPSLALSSDINPSAASAAAAAAAAARAAAAILVVLVPPVLPCAADCSRWCVRARMLLLALGGNMPNPAGSTPLVPSHTPGDPGAFWCPVGDPPAPAKQSTARASQFLSSAA